jgi:hypothetical protein
LQSSASAAHECYVHGDCRQKDITPKPDPQGESGNVVNVASVGRCHVTIAVCCGGHRGMGTLDIQRGFHMFRRTSPKRLSR